MEDRKNHTFRPKNPAGSTRVEPKTRSSSKTLTNKEAAVSMKAPLIALRGVVGWPGGAPLNPASATAREEKAEEGREKRTEEGL